MRKFAYQEEVKILVSELLRGGDFTDEEWAIRYEQLKNLPEVDIESFGNSIKMMVDNHFTIEEAVNVLRNTMQEKISKINVQLL